MHKRRVGRLVEVWGVFALFFVGVLSAPPSARALDEQVLDAQSTFSGSGRVKTAKIKFSDGLFLDDDIWLRGAHKDRRLTFTRPASWRVLSGSKLHLIYTHSGILLPGHSALTVKVTDAAKTIRLDVLEGQTRESVIPLDPTRLAPYNPIEFIVDQHYTLDCEDPFHEGLWTQISRESYIEFVYQEEEAFTDLSVFPFPYFDPLAYPPTKLSIALPEGPSAETATAAVLVTGAVSQEVTYRPLEIDFVEGDFSSAGRNVIVVGTPQENPAIASILSRSGVSIPGGDDGLIASVPIPGDTVHGVLIVTGSTPAGVHKAAQALVDRSTRATLTGRHAVVQAYATRDRPEKRDWEGFVPARTDFTLQDIGFSGETVRGVFSLPVALDVKVAPDAHPIEFRQKLHVHYAYGADANPKLSTIEVKLNGVSLHSAPLVDEEGSESEWLTLEIPWDIYSPYNRLEFQFHLLPKTVKACERVSDRHLWGTVYPDTNFTFPRDYWMRVPDLSVFARWGYPFTVRSDLSETAFVLPGPGDKQGLRALVRIAAFLTKSFHRPNIQTRVHYADQVPDDVLNNHHLIVISPEQAGALGLRLADRSLILDESGGLRLKEDESDRLLSVLSHEGLVLEEIESPWSSSRVALLVKSDREELLADLVSQDSAKLLNALDGNISVVSDGQATNSARLGEAKTIGQIPLRRRLQYLFSAYWQLFLIIALVGIVLLSIAIRAALQQRRDRLVRASMDRG